MVLGYPCSGSHFQTQCSFVLTTTGDMLKQSNTTRSKLLQISLHVRYYVYTTKFLRRNYFHELRTRTSCLHSTVSFKCWNACFLRKYGMV